MRSATALRLAARLARREVRRRPGRTVLVALLVALPVAGMTMAAGFVRTEQRDAATLWMHDWGRTTDVGFTSWPSDAYASPENAADPDAVLATLPPGSRTTTWRNSSTGVRTTGKLRSSADVTDIPSHPIAADLFQVMEGRLPSAPGEVFLARDIAEDLAVAVGDSIDLERPYKATWTVVGVGERRAYWGSHVVVLGPGTAFPWADGSAQESRSYAVDLPAGTARAEVAALLSVLGPDAFAPSLRPRAYYSSDSATEAVAWSLVIGAIVLTVVGIVIASAFAAGARRQLTTLGQLAANGAAPSVLRQVLFLQGTWTGVIGALLGLALGGLGLVGLAPHADRMFSRDVDPWTIRIGDLVPIVLLGVAAATVAALIPARTSVRVPVLAALAGRRPLAKVPRWVTGLGAVASVCGLGLLGLAVLGGSDATHDTQLWALTAIVGGMGVLLGACAMTPGYTSLLEPLARRLHGSWRLAARSLARQRTRTSAVVSGVCAASALAVGAAALVLSFEAEGSGHLWSVRPDDIQLIAEQTTTTGTAQARQFSSEAAPAPRELVESVRSALPGSQVLEVTTARPPAGWRWHVSEPDGDGAVEDSFSVVLGGPGTMAVAVFDASTARVYELSAEHVAALKREGALLLGQSEGPSRLTFVPDGGAEPFPPGAGAAAGPIGDVVGGRGPAPAAPHPVAVVDGRPYSTGELPRLLVMPDAVGRLGLVARAPMTVIRTPEPMTSDQVTLVNDIMEDHRLDTAAPVAQPTQTSVYMIAHYPDERPSPFLLEAVLTGTALLFSLFVVAVSLALAAAETRDERDVLTVVGAPPRTMWGVSGRKAALLTVLGGALAVPVGFLPVVVLVLAEDPTPPLVFPWRTVLLLLLAVPVVAGVVTTVGSALALRARPVRVSTMAFD